MLSPVKLYPPDNLTVKNGSDYNLWYYWNQTYSQCVESEVRFRVNDNKWGVGILKEQKRDLSTSYPSFSFIIFFCLFSFFSTPSYCPQTSKIPPGKQSYCINLPSSSSRYELQVRSKIENGCGDSIFWSDWSEPVVWGSNNSTGKKKKKKRKGLYTATYSSLY